MSLSPEQQPRCPPPTAQTALLSQIPSLASFPCTGQAPFTTSTATSNPSWIYQPPAATAQQILGIQPLFPPSQTAMAAPPPQSKQVLSKMVTTKKGECLVTFHWATVHCTCFSHMRLKTPSLCNFNKLTWSLVVFEYPAATHLFTISLPSRGPAMYIRAFLFWRHVVTTPYLHRNRMELEGIQLAVETYLFFAESHWAKNLQIFMWTNSNQSKVKE